MRRMRKGLYREQGIDLDFSNATIEANFRLSLSDGEVRHYHPSLDSLHAEREIFETDEDTKLAIWRVGIGIVDNPDQWEFISDLASVVRHGKALQITAVIPVFGAMSTLMCDRAADLDKKFHYYNVEVHLSDAEGCYLYLGLTFPDDGSFRVEPL